MLTHEELFNYYQNKLDWINRRLEPDALKFYNETAETWKHAKEITFYWYEDMRYHVDGGILRPEDCFDYNNKIKAAYKPYEITNEDGKVSTFPCIGILKYRGNTYAIYNDDYGMQDFIVIDGREITVDSFGGGIDWYYELDRIIDKIFD
jgi:hypothetical protein